MAFVTLQVVDGFEKGQVYADMCTPITIGREEDNTIQLNDERVSRFHAKIQEDGGRFILTDLDSTNGTRVNGHPIQMRIMQIGDQVGLGRSVLLFGSPAQIAERGRQLTPKSAVMAPENQTISHASDLLESNGIHGEDRVDPLFPDGPPELPDELRPVQRAQVSDLLAYVHEQLATIVEAGRENLTSKTPEMRADWATWQRLLKLEMDLASYLRRMSNPSDQ